MWFKTATLCISALTFSLAQESYAEKTPFDISRRGYDLRLTQGISPNENETKAGPLRVQFIKDSPEGRSVQIRSPFIENLNLPNRFFNPLKVTISCISHSGSKRCKKINRKNSRLEKLQIKSEDQSLIFSGNFDFPKNAQKVTQVKGKLTLRFPLRFESARFLSNGVDTHFKGKLHEFRIQGVSPKRLKLSFIKGRSQLIAIYSRDKNGDVIPAWNRHLNGNQMDLHFSHEVESYEVIFADGFHYRTFPFSITR